MKENFKIKTIKGNCIIRFHFTDLDREALNISSFHTLFILEGKFPLSIVSCKMIQAAENLEHAAQIFQNTFEEKLWHEFAIHDVKSHKKTDKKNMYEVGFILQTNRLGSLAENAESEFTVDGFCTFIHR